MYSINSSSGFTIYFYSFGHQSKSIFCSSFFCFFSFVSLNFWLTNIMERYKAYTPYVWSSLVVATAKQILIAQYMMLDHPVAQQTRISHNTMMSLYCPLVHLLACYTVTETAIHNNCVRQEYYIILRVR